MFAKIEDGILIYAKMPYHVGDKLIFTNDPAQTDDTADMQAALNLLGVVPEEETT